MEGHSELTIRFMDGSKLDLVFPPPAKDQSNISQRLDDLLKDQYLLVEAEGTLMMFPFANIKYIEARPAPTRMMPKVLQGAKIIAG